MTTSFLHTLQHHAFLSPILVVGGFENFDFTDNFQIDNVPEENKEKLQQNTKILCLICSLTSKLRNTVHLIIIKGDFCLLSLFLNHGKNQTSEYDFNWRFMRVFFHGLKHRARKTLFNGVKNY